MRQVERPSSVRARTWTLGALCVVLATIALVSAAFVAAVGRGQPPATTPHSVAVDVGFFADADASSGATIEAAAIPGTLVDPDSSSVEIGLRFIPKVDGKISAIQFYATPANSGPHVGTLWDANGSKLATVAFADRGRQGWSTAELPTPVPVVAGNAYVASYLAPKGHYASDQDYFTSLIETDYLIAPEGAGVYKYGTGGFPTENYRNANYYVDVRFTSAGAVKPTREPSPHIGSVVELPTEAWWGGPAYYGQFANAKAAGWDDPGFFPISVFYGKPSHADELADLGINTFMGAEHDGSPVSLITSAGLALIAQSEWTSAEVGTDANVVGWHVSDECDMGLSGCESPQGEYGSLAIQKGFVDTFRAKDDGRFLQANFGNGVLGTFWSPMTMDDHLALMDVTTVDKYAYTSPHVQDLFRGSPYWPSETNPSSASAYGWQQDRMESMMEPVASKPNWIFVEAARPYLTEPGATTITVPQIEGAVWSGIIHGAAGIAYFQHNNDGCGNYALIDCSAALRAGVKALNEEVTSLAAVINSPSYVWEFGDGLDTALKVHSGYGYIFAMTDGGSGARDLTLPPGTTGTIEVVGEGRTITPTAGVFTDSFSAEYTHHVYRVALD